MHASELNRAVAQATGESICTIQRLGFSLCVERAPEDEGDMLFGPNVVDWDEVEISRTQFQHGIGQNVPTAA
ncbi:hypothetical protein [Bremerella sp.]|uniref:hypothetical protein n=1 Tax=Bremerella sp. TaxID=2795602 RepID=UPI00391CA537